MCWSCGSSSRSQRPGGAAEPNEGKREGGDGEDAFRLDRHEERRHDQEARRVRAAVDEGDDAHDSAEHAVRDLLLRGRVEEHDCGALAHSSEERPGHRDRQRAGEPEHEVGRQVEAPREQARERLASDGVPGQEGPALIALIV
jgi:hypothetical protein